MEKTKQLYKTIPAVKCSCGKIFEEDSSNYVRIRGNVYLGKDGGLIGNNIDNNNVVFRDSVFCFDCFWTYLSSYIKPTVYNKGLTTDNNQQGEANEAV